MSTSSRKAMAGMVLITAGVGGFCWWWTTRDRNNDVGPIDMVRVLDLNNRGIAYMEQFEYAKAAEAFDEIVKLAPRWQPARINLGIALLNDHKNEASLEQAVSLFEKALQEDAKSNHAEYCLGILRMHQARELKQAVEHFRRVAERDPGDPHAWFFMAGLLSQMDDLNGAKEAYEKVVALDPYIPGTFNNLQLLYRRLGDDKRANELLDHFLELQKAKWESHANLKYAEMGKYAEVIGRNPQDKTPAVGPLPLFARDAKAAIQLGKN